MSNTISRAHICRANQRPRISILQQPKTLPKKHTLNYFLDTLDPKLAAIHKRRRGWEGSVMILVDYPMCWRTIVTGTVLQHVGPIRIITLCIQTVQQWQPWRWVLRHVPY